jgi:hypothetical protein
MQHARVVWHGPNRDETLDIGTCHWTRKLLLGLPYPPSLYACALVKPKTSAQTRATFQAGVNRGHTHPQKQHLARQFFRKQTTAGTHLGVWSRVGPDSETIE